MNAYTPRVARDAFAWLGLYVLVVTAPLLALLPWAVSAPGAGVPWDFALALGYASLAMFGVQFALTARFKRATAPFGIDIVFYFHRYLAVFALAIALGHAAFAVAVNPALIGTFDPRRAPLHLSAGWAALALFALVVALSLARRALRFEYESWRLTHALLATAALALALAHLFGAGRYLDAAWKQVLWIGYGALWLALIAYVRLLRPWRLARAPWHVTAVRPERGRVTTLVLEPPRGTRLAFSPGQVAWLTLGASPFAMREHPFSIASSAERGDRVELSIKELGDFTATIQDTPVGAVAYLDAPYGTFGIDRSPDAEGYVFIVGGIGIAPMMSMLRTLVDRGDRRSLWLFYGNREWERVAFREELEELAQRIDLRVVHLLLEPPPGWTGERGFVTRDVLARRLPADGRDRLEYLVCGPTPMTHAVEEALATLGIPARRVHSEIFDWV
jgi:predicted ferric reductase